MTQIKKIQDLLYFKGKLQPDNINLELVNKEMAQRIVVNNNQNNDNISKFIDSSEDKIKQFHITLKNLENKLA